jgi:hypothetical protein
VHHVSDDTLEQYAMQTLPESEAGPLEEHLLVRNECRDRLDAEIEYVTGMRGASVRPIPGSSLNVVLSLVRRTDNQIHLRRTFGSKWLR